MRRSALALLCLALFSSFALADDVRTVPAALPQADPARLLQIAGFDGIFEKFGETLALSGRASGLDDERFLAAWEATTRDSFGREELGGMLVASLAERLAADEILGIEAFYASAAGNRIMSLEAATQAIPADRQLATIAKGQAAYLAASAGRRQQIDELMALSHAEFTFALLAESMRGMAVGLHVHKMGEIAVPWDEIDAGVAAKLAGMEESLRDASRGVMTVTYAPLSDDELEAFLSFMRLPATQKFYGIATVVIGSTIRDTMATLGDRVAKRLAAVVL